MEINDPLREELPLALDMAKLSRHVYGAGDALPEGWKVSLESSPKVEKKTGFFATLYERTSPKDGEIKYAVAFRGTTPRLSNIIDDIKIALGILPRGTYGTAIKFLQQVCKQKNIKPTDIAVGGHSSGGLIAKLAAYKLSIKKVFAFNSPGASKRVLREITRSLQKDIPKQDKPYIPEILELRSSKDLIGAFRIKLPGIEEIKTIKLDTNGDYGLHHSIEELVHSISKELGDNEPTISPKELKSLPLKTANSVSEIMANSETVGKVISKFLGEKSRKIDKKQPKATGPTM